MKCVHCGNELIPGSKFCTNCGTPVTEPEAPAASEASQPLPQDPMGSWPAPDFSASAESASFDSETAEIPPVSDQTAPAYDETGAQDLNSTDPASHAQEAPGGQMPPAYPQDTAGAVPPAYPQNQTGQVPAGYPQNNNGGVPLVYPNQPYYPQPGYPQGPAPQKKSSKLVLGIVLGIAALIIALIVILVVILLNNQNNKPSPSSSSEISSSVSSEVSGDSSSLAGETQTVTIGSASFTVPAEWELDVDDDGTIFLYPNDEEIMVIYCFAGEASSYSDNDYLESYGEGYDDYQYIDLKETTISGTLGKLHTYYAYVSDIDYKISSFYFTIGGDLMSMDYFCPLLSSADAMLPLQNVMQTLQTAQGANTSSAPASSTGGSAAAQDAYGEGMYKVGSDLPAGEYVLLPASEFSAYYEVNSTSSGNLEDIIDNDNFDGRRYLTVADGQYLTIQRCSMVPLNKAPAVDTSSGVVPEGMYRVGIDIPAGEYKLHNNSDFDGYYEVRSSSIAEEGFDSIITNDNFSGDVYVTVENGQYLVVNRAELQLPQ